MVSNNYQRAIRILKRNKGRKVDALAHRGDEGRNTLRKATGS